MAVRETASYIAEDKPAYYVFIWKEAHTSTGRPARPLQIFRADSWEEARSFAKVFASLTQLQYATATTLVKMDGSGLEAAAEDYWNEKGTVHMEPHVIPAEVVKKYSQTMRAEPIARETEAEGVERMRRIRKLMEKAKPGETLIDVLARDWNAQRTIQAKKAVESLFRYGDYSPRQGRLHPIKRPRKKRGLVEAFEAPDEKEVERLRHQFLTPETEGRIYQSKRLATEDVTIKGEMKIYYALDEFSSKPRVGSIAVIFSSPEIKPTASMADLPAFVRDYKITGPSSANGDARAVIDFIKTGIDYVDMYFEARRNGMDDREYTEWAVDVGVPVITSGQYILTWTPPTDEEIPLFVRELAAGVPLDEAQRRELNRAVEPGQEVLLPSEPPRKVRKFKRGEKKEPETQQTRFAFEKERRDSAGLSWKDYWVLEQLKGLPRTAFYFRVWAAVDDWRLDELARKGYVVKQKVVGQDGYAITEIGLRSLRERAFEDGGGSGWDTKISNPRGFFTFRQWALRNKKATAGATDLDNALQEAKTGSGDLTASEARGRVEDAYQNIQAMQEEGEEGKADHPWSDIADLVDFETIEEKERMAVAGQRKLEELKKELDEMVAAKIITKEQARDTLVGLEREKLPSKQKKMFQQTIAELEKKLAEAQQPPPKQKYKLGQKVSYIGQPGYEVTDADLQGRVWTYTVRKIGIQGEFIAREHDLLGEGEEPPLKPPPPPPAPIVVEPKKPRVSIAVPRERFVEAAKKFTQSEVDLLEQAFRNIISRKLRRDLFPTEIDQFERLIVSMEQLSPPLRFLQAKTQVENLARGLAAKGTPGRIIVRYGQSRVNELIEKSLREPLSEAEKEELAKLEGKGPEGPFEYEEMQYEPPNIIIIAEGGPSPAFGGKPVVKGQEYPRELGRYWTIEIAELNLANFEHKGFKARIQRE